MNRSCLGLAAILFQVVSSGAHAQTAPPVAPHPGPAATACIPPGPPPPQSLRPLSPGSRPFLPACISALGGTQACRRGEVARYNSEIQTFNARVEASNQAARRYVDAVNSWTGATGAYARCEINAVNRLTAPGG